MRPLLAVVAAAVTAALGALILGEYELAGVTPFVAGALFGLVVAEAAVATAGRRSGAPAVTTVAVAAPLAAGAGMVWAAWISSGRDWSFVPGEAWAGVALAALAAAAWAGGLGRVRGRRRPAPGSPPGP